MLLIDYWTVAPEYDISNSCCQHLLLPNHPRFRSSGEKKRRWTSKWGGNRGGQECAFVVCVWDVGVWQWFWNWAGVSEQDESHTGQQMEGQSKKRVLSWNNRLVDGWCMWVDQRNGRKKNGKGKIKSEEVALSEAAVSSGRKNAEISACGYEHSVWFSLCHRRGLLSLLWLFIARHFQFPADKQANPHTKIHTLVHVKCWLRKSMARELEEDFIFTLQHFSPLA